MPVRVVAGMSCFHGYLLKVLSFTAIYLKPHMCTILVNCFFASNKKCHSRHFFVSSLVAASSKQWSKEPAECQVACDLGDADHLLIMTLQMGYGLSWPWQAFKKCYPFFLKLTRFLANREVTAFQPSYHPVDLSSHPLARRWQPLGRNLHGKGFAGQNQGANKHDWGFLGKM